MHRPPLRFRALAVAGLASVAALGVVAPASQARSHRTKLTVMSRNLYLGADLIPLAGAQPGAPLEQAVGQMWNDVQATDPNGRMKLVAGEIAKNRPDLVGLQEVSLWRTGPKGDAHARNVVYDYLATIRAELKRLHAPYRVVSVIRHFDIHGPSDQNLEIRLTMGDAVLARRGVKVRHVRSRDFKHNLGIPTAALGTVTVTRSYDSMDATFHGAHFRFVNAHLEAYSGKTAGQQAKELLAGPLKTRGETILVGDLNSGPRQAKADRVAWNHLHRAGFKEARNSVNSCCFDGDLHGGRWTQFIDHVMARPGVKVLHTTITGRERTPTGVTPSDHGGVVSTIRLR